MKSWLTRHRDVVIPALVVLAAAMVLADLMRYKLLTTSILASNKDALAALSSAVSIVALSVGAVFSYYRFFRGRTFYSRAELKINVIVIPMRVGASMHAVILEVKNIGTLSIWDPIPVMRIDEYGPDGVHRRVIDSWSEAQSPRGEGATLAVIDSGETASFWTEIEVSEEMWAVFYTAFVHSSQGEIWKQVTVAQNKKIEVDTEK
jgi:hypothetical protein